MKKRFIIFWAFVCVHIISLAQSENILLYNQLSIARDSIKYVDVLNKLAITYNEINADSTFYYAFKALNTSQSLNYYKGEADAANNLGILHDLKGNSQQALRYYNDAYNRYEKLGDVSNMIQTTMNVAIVFYEMEKTAKTLSGFQKAFALSKDLRNDSIMSFVYANYAVIFADNLSKDSIQYYITKSRIIARKYNDYRMMIFADQVVAENISSSDPQKAAIILQQALSDALAKHFYYSATDILIDLANVTTDSAKAAQYYLQSFSIAKERGFTIGVRYAYEKLYDFYQAQGDDRSSLFYAEKLLYFYDKQKDLDNNYGIDYIDYAQKNNSLAESVNNAKFQQRAFLLTLTICLLSITLLIILWLNSKRLKKLSNAILLQFRQSEITTASLDKVNKNYARIIKVVAHDLRTPISSINMISSMMADGSITQDELKEFTALITRLSKNSFNLIDQLLNSDLDEQQQIVRSEISFNQLLLNCTCLLDFKAKEKQQQIIVSQESDYTLFADADKLTRVINNLVMNAIKFSPVGSSIKINTFPKKNDLIVAIIDEGIGIPPDFKNKIFDPFTSAKRVGTNGETTFGLGLYICKRIIEAHGGLIWFESIADKGTVFYIQLPLLITDSMQKTVKLNFVHED